MRQIARLWQFLLLCDNVCVNWFDSSWKIFGRPKGRNCSFEFEKGFWRNIHGSAKSRRTYESVTQMYLIILLLKASWIHLLSKQLYHVRIRELNRRSKHIPLGHPLFRLVKSNIYSLSLTISINKFCETDHDIPYISL